MSEDTVPETIEQPPHTVPVLETWKKDGDAGMDVRFRLADGKVHRLNIVWKNGVPKVWADGVWDSIDGKFVVRRDLPEPQPQGNLGL